MNVPRAFAPSSEALLKMIDSAEAKFEAAREQAALRKEAQASKRAEQAALAEAEQRRRAFWR